MSDDDIRADGPVFEGVLETVLERSESAAKKLIFFSYFSIFEYT